MLQLHLSDQQFYRLLRCILYLGFDSNICLDKSQHSLKVNFNNLWQTRTSRTPAFWDAPRRPKITTCDSHQIPSQNKTKSKLPILKKLPKMQILKFCKQIYMPHILKLPDKMYKYEMDPTRTVGATEWIRDAGRTDRRRGRTDRRRGRTEWNQYTQQLHCARGIIKISNDKHISLFF